MKNTKHNRMDIDRSIEFISRLSNRTTNQLNWRKEDGQTHASRVTFSNPVNDEVTHDRLACLCHLCKRKQKLLINRNWNRNSENYEIPVILFEMLILKICEYGFSHTSPVSMTGSPTTAANTPKPIPFELSPLEGLIKTRNCNILRTRQTKCVCA